MAGQNMLKKRIQETQDYDTVLKNRSFGQNKDEGAADEAEDLDKDLSKKIKTKINKLFGERILTESKNDEFKAQLYTAINQLLEKEDTEIDLASQKILVQKIMDDILGFGPIQELIEDPNISEIMVSRWDKIYIEQNGSLVLMPEYHFDSDDHLRDVIDKIVQPIGRSINESEPMVDARLPDGSRVNATVSPISPDGATLTIRKFKKEKLTGDDYLKFGSLDEKMIKFLNLCVQARCNVIVSGGTGSGKTTLLNMLSNFIPPGESIVTVEDSCELTLYQDNIRRLEARPANSEGRGAVSIRDLVKNCLRMRPDRIVVGEIRDGTVVDMFRAMSSGHDGSLTTIHANSPKDLVDATLPLLFGMSDMSFSEYAKQQQVASAVDLIVQISRLRDGSRKITNITHVVGLGRDGASKLKVKNVDDNKIYLQDIFKYKQRGINERKQVCGDFLATGYKPKDIIDKLAASGIEVPDEIFQSEEAMEDE